MKKYGNEERQDENSPFMLLVEGGGSHTQAFVVDGDSIIKKLTLSSLNQVGQTDDAHYAVIDHVADVRKDFSEINLTYFAIGAAATPKYLNKVSDDLQKRWTAKNLPWQQVIITNDIVPLMFTEENEANQLIVISGTGSGIVARASFNHIMRSGAHEYLLGDEGGAFDIGRSGLRAILQMKEKRGKPTLLADLAKTWSNEQELNWFVYESKNPKQTIASFAPMVFEADQNGDPVATEILDHAAKNLAHICDAALQGIGRPRNIVVTCTGSLLCEPTARLHARLKTLLLQNASIEKFEIKTVDNRLLQDTARQLVSSPSLFNKIAGALPARIY